MPRFALSAAATRGASNRIKSSIVAMEGARVLFNRKHGVVSPATQAAVAAATTGNTKPAPDAGVSKTVAAHLQQDMLSQRVFYPAHDRRTESKAYHASHDLLVNKNNRPCLVCSVTAADLHANPNDPKTNPFGAKALETHHRIVEWSLAQAVDLAKFNDRIVGALHRHDPTNAKYAQPFTRDQMLAWIDADVDNLWVLCDVHHRHKYVGIHAISGPIWGPQDILQTGFGPVMAVEKAAKPLAPPK
jgi:hypothetical protein